MTCRIARAYGIAPEVPWHWPLTWWIKVRDEYTESLKPPPEEEDEEI